MPALKPTKFIATVVWLGHVSCRDRGLASSGIELMTLGFSGFEAEDHAGLTRSSDSRVRQQYPLGTEIRNTRQLSIVSQEELDAIAADMGLEALKPEWIGASVVLAGIPDFSRVPPSSRLIADDGVSLTIDMENRPCNLPAKPIEQARPGSGRAFKAAARGRRGVTAWVEREGNLRRGMELVLHIPDQPAWSMLTQARAPELKQA